MVTIRTSETHPIRVDFIDPRLLPVPGRLGLTLAPGKKCASSLANVVWERNLQADLKRLRDVYATQVLVSLMEDVEYEACSIPHLLSDAGYLGMQVVHFPIPDLLVPELHQEQGFEGLTRHLSERLELGENVVVHCLGGLGRSGLLAAAILVAHGLAAGEAIVTVRKARQGAVETHRQEEYLRRFAAGIHAAGAA